jgi:hypothetical protein
MYGIFTVSCSVEENIVRKPIYNPNKLDLFPSGLGGQMVVAFVKLVPMPNGNPGFVYGTTGTYAKRMMMGILPI